MQRHPTRVSISAEIRAPPDPGSEPRRIRAGATVAALLTELSGTRSNAAATLTCAAAPFACC